MELIAPSHWRCIDVISDLHLHAADPLTYAAWSDYMHSTQADAVLILGDLFEVWVGDDALLQADSFEAHCVDVLRDAGKRLALSIMQGNRDFLMGPALMQACGAQALPDPCVLAFGGQRWLLTHGDALCLEDTDYQAFRTLVRSDAWQQEFLAKPLQQRQSIARAIRQESQSLKRDGAGYADVDTGAALALLSARQCTHLLHGHTHKPGEHTLGNDLHRMVLSDWDMHAKPSRAEVLRLSLAPHGGVTWQRIPANLIAGPRD